MCRKELLRALMTKYSFEKAHAMIQITTEDRIYEDNGVKITMIRTPQADVFELEWKN